MQEHSLTDYPNSDGIDTPTQGRATIYNSNSNSNLIRQQQQQQQQQQHHHHHHQQHQQQKQYPSLGVKLSRSSNVVSFSKTHPHLLAAGLDKVRNDPCLLVWDVTRSIDSYCNTPTGSQTPTAAFSNSIRGHVQQESRSTITSQWRIDSRDNYENDRPKYSDMAPISTPGSGSREQGPVRQYGSSEAISSCAWSEHTNSLLLIAGMGNKYLRVYDVRADASSNPLQFATKAVHGIAVDPFCPYRLASYTEEGIIKLWDIRKNNDAILTLNPDNKNNLSKIVFSPTQPGFLASLTKDATHIDLWDIQETCSLQSAVNSSVQKSTTTSNYPSATQLPQHPPQLQPQSSSTAPTKLEHSSSQTVLQTLSTSHNDDDELSIPVLWKSRKTRSSIKKFASFAFIPNSIDSSKPISHNILTIHTDGKFESVKVQEACQISWQPSGGMIMTGKKGLLSYHPAFLDSKIDQTMANLRIDGDINEDVEDEDEIMYQIERKELLLSRQNTITVSKDRALAAELDKDISVVMRKRLLEGYSMDV